MRNQRRNPSWVVYQMTILGTPGGRSAVCDQSEWDKMEAERPGFHTLIRGGFSSESEAEKVARTAGYDAGKSKRW